MKILYTTDQLFLHGGIEKVLSQKANYFAEVLGYEVFILTTNQNGNQPCYQLSDKINIQDLDINLDGVINDYDYKLLEDSGASEDELADFNSELSGVRQSDTWVYIYNHEMTGDVIVNKEDYEMTLEEFDDYIRNTGDFAYKITNALPSNYKWSSLSTAQQLYALVKTYEFSKAYWKKKLKPEYSAKSNWMDELCDNKVDFQTYARVIINQAEKYSPKD